ncbi:hypothetical protein ACFX13_003909 [Malus domestica]
MMKAGASKFDLAQALVEEKKPTGTEAFDELNKSFLLPLEILVRMGIQEGEEEEEEEKKKKRRTDKDGDEGEAAFGRCIVCLKYNMHFSYHCPYCKKVPSGATVGPGYGM